MIVFLAGDKLSQAIVVRLLPSLPNPNHETASKVERVIRPLSGKMFEAI